MIATPNEFTKAIRHLRALLIRKSWRNHNSEESDNQWILDAKLVNDLTYNDPDRSEQWALFETFFQGENTSYYSHEERLAIEELINYLKQTEDGNPPLVEDFYAQFNVLKIDLDSYQINSASNSVNELLLPFEPLQKLILEIDNIEDFPNDGNDVLLPYAVEIQKKYPEFFSDICSLSNTQKIHTAIKILDFYLLSKSVSLKHESHDFEKDLAQLYRQKALNNFLSASIKLQENTKSSNRFYKQVSSIVSAVHSGLLVSIPDSSKHTFNVFNQNKNIVNALAALSVIENFITSIEQVKAPKTFTHAANNDDKNSSVLPEASLKHPYFLDGRLTPSLKESPKYDDELIAELKESFLEEVKETIFPLIDSMIEILKSTPYEEKDIMELRRAYHTLKGSGYTASLPIIGEIGWQVERVINGVRDGLYSFNEAILYHAIDGYDAIKELMSKPQSEGDIQELERITYQAQYLIDHKGIIHPSRSESQYNSKNTQLKIENPRFTSFDDIPENFTSPYRLLGSKNPDPIQSTELDKEIIAELNSGIIDELREDILPEINLISIKLLNHGSGKSELKNLNHIFHTLKGNFFIADQNILGQILRDAESIINNIELNKYVMSPEIIFHISDIYRALKKYIKNKNVAEAQLLQLLYQGSELLLYDGNINHLLLKQSSIEKRPTSHSSDISSVVVPDIDAPEFEEKLEMSDAELTQLLIDNFSTCQKRTYSALKHYGQSLSMCLLHPTFSDQSTIKYTLLNVYHKHLLLFRAHGVTPNDERLILWGKVLALILEIIKTNNVNETIANEYIDILQKPILNINILDIATQSPSKPNSTEETDPEIFATFTEEAQDVLEHTDELIGQWKIEGFAPDSELVSEIRREMHTLKGGARMVGKIGLGQLSHALESLFDPNYITLFDADQNRFDLLQRAVDHLQALLDSPNKQIDKEGFNLLSALHVLIGEDPPPEIAPSEEDITSDTPITEVTKKTATAAQSELSTLRISPSQLNKINERVSDNQVLMVQYKNQLSNISSSLAELDRTIQVLNTTARNIEIETEAQIISRHARYSRNKQEFDPLELDQFSELQHLARSVSESIEDIHELRRNIYDSLERMGSSLSKFNSNQDTITDQLTDIGTVSFNQILPRLRRIVRQVSKANNKQVELIAIDTDTQIERVVLEQMTTSFEHMIRNAIIHGIESEKERKEKGKSLKGTITLRVTKISGDLVITLKDDGRGFDINKIKAKAINDGIITQSSNHTDKELVNMVMLPGFTTAAKLSEDAGRGVGLDVLGKALTILKGEVELSFTHDQGVTFTITIPATLMIVKALIIEANQLKYAIPINNILGVAQHKNIQVINETEFNYHYNHYKVYDLTTIYGCNHVDRIQKSSDHTYLLFNIAGKNIAFGVESIDSQLEIVVRPLNPQINKTIGLSGSTVTPDGDTIFSIDINELATTDLNSIHNKIDITKEITTAENDIAQELVMVIDDSITMRKVSERLLTRAGYNVITVKDGIEAIEKLEDTQPDVIMLDIEMPRMDGFEVLTHLRSTEQFLHTPVIMVTSRTGEKHRQRAFDIGANEYIGKPYQSDHILQCIEHLLAEQKTKESI